MKLSEKILYCRKRVGLSQEALAGQIGVSRQAVSKWETGEAEPEISKLRLLASTFNVTVDWLLNEDQPMSDQAMPTPIDKSEPKQSSNWVDAVPGMIGRLLRRYSWLFGVYLAVGGTLFTGIGALARTISISMFSGLNDRFPGGIGNFEGFDAQGDAIYSNFASINPVAMMGTFIMAFGILMIIAGIVLAIVLKKHRTMSHDGANEASS